MNPEEFNRCFLDWIETWKSALGQDIINIDGKTLKHSYDSVHGKSAIHILSAWASKAGIVLGQIKIDDKSNEITAIPKQFDLLEVEGSIITIELTRSQPGGWSSSGRRLRVGIFCGF